MQTTRKLKTGTLHRSAKFDRAAVDQAARTVALSFSSEAPVERWFGAEILDHSASSVRMARLADAGPLLMDHDPECQVGVIEDVSLGQDRVGRALVRFGKSAGAEAAFQDVTDGIRQHVSVGYRVHKMILESKTDTLETYRATDWEPMEISIVAIPADNSVGMGRSADTGAFETEIETPDLIEKPAQTRADPIPATPKEHPAMNTATTTTTDLAALEQAARADAGKAERSRTNEIAAMGEVHAKRGGDKLAMQYIREGKSVDEFRNALLDSVANEPVQTERIQMNDREAKSYSYVRAIASALARAEGQKTSGFEVDISEEIERNIPANYKRNGGIFVPTQVRTAISEALYNTSTKGSSTVFTQAGEFIDLLRNASVAVRLGARVMSGLTGPVSFPTQATAATVYWMAENSGTDVTASNATLGSVGLSPKTLQGTTAFSRQLMAQASIDVETLIRQDLAQAHALAWDVAAIHGTGSNDQPTGIYAASNVNSKAMGGVPTFAKLIDMITEVMKDNALAGSLAFATTPGMAGKLAQTVVAASTDTRMIWDGKLDNGTLCGYSAFASNQVSSTLVGGAEHGIVFGNWSDLLIGMWGALELVVDPYALKKQGMIEVTSFQLCDIALRHPESFCKATGATIV